MKTVSLILMLSLVMAYIVLNVNCQSTPENEQNFTTPGIELPPSEYLPEIPRVSAEEVKAKLDAGINLIIIDSRSKLRYDESHILGAISIPVSTMAGPYRYLDSYDEIATY